MATQWIVRENATGKLYQLATAADDIEVVYHLFAVRVQGGDVEDTGNVDIDIVQVKNLKPGEVVEVLADE